MPCGILGPLTPLTSPPTAIMRFVPHAFLLALLVLSACTAETPDSETTTDAAPTQIIDDAAVERLNSTLSGLTDAGMIAGVSTLIYEDGEEAYFNAFGMADIENEVPMARNTIVQIYSMTKPITGVALMTLYEDGAFQLDDSLSQYAPEFANMRVYAGEDADGNPIYEAPRRPITIRDITRHTAGFATGDAPEAVRTLSQEANAMDRNNTLTQMAEKLGSVPLFFHPGERWAYGPSVDVQAFLVERLSGQPFDEYVQEHIFDPLGMTETRYFVPEEDRDRLAAVYRRSREDSVLTRIPDEAIHSFNTNEWPLTPGGFGFTATIDNYSRFAQMLAHEGELDGVRILQPETVQLMATSHLSDDVEERSWLPSKGQVGFGVDFAVRLRPPASAEENNGVVGEFFWDGAASTLFWVDPTNDLTAVLFVQLMPFDQVGLHKAFRDAVYGPITASAEIASTE